MQIKSLAFERTGAGFNIHDVSNKLIGTILVPGDTEPTIRITDAARSLFYSDVLAIAAHMYASQVDKYDPDKKFNDWHDGKTQ